MSTAEKTLAIKARVYNTIRTDLYKKVSPSDKLSKEYSIDYLTKYMGYTILTDKQKLELFEKWFLLNWEAHKELNSFKKKRKQKRLILADRIKRGKKAKVKTTLAEYELQKQLAHAI